MCGGSKAPPQRRWRLQLFVEPSKEKLTQISLCLCAAFSPPYHDTKTPGQEKRNYQLQAETRGGFPHGPRPLFTTHKGKAAYYFSKERSSF